jgi:ribonuclease Z
VKRRATIALGVLGVAVGAAVYLYRGEISVALLRRGAAKSIFRDTIATLPDGLHAGLCGTGSPYPDPTRSGPCTAIIAGNRLFIVDVGRGAADVVARMGLRSGRAEAVLLTHFHSDHIDGLGQFAEQRWVAWQARAPLSVIGPPGVDRVVSGFNEAYRQNGTYRTSHHGDTVAAPSGFGLTDRPFQFANGEHSVVVLDGDGLRITAFTVNHEPVLPAVGYRFDYKGRSIVVSGDTAKSPNLVRVATGADVLIHEAISPRLLGALEEQARVSGSNAATHVFRDPLSFHTAPWDAADEASAARVGALVFTHFIPGLPIRTLEGPFLGNARKRFAGPLFVGRDGDLISLPAGGGTMNKGNLLY